MLGLSAIVASSAVLFSAIKYIGVLYLFYVGITELRRSMKTKKIALQHETEEIVIQKINSSPRITWYFYAGFLTNVLNPKAILWFCIRNLLILRLRCRHNSLKWVSLEL